jgi:DNA polymerase-3 subunit gamma/tau
MSKKSKSENPRPDPGYTVLARRYRPQQFRDLVGQEPVAQALVNALESNRVAHAYLFTGARGVGKTSTARILAKALNCARGPTATPCDACELCRSIASGEDVDVLEIDGASNRGIDEVREIRQNVQYRPGRARFKIYIIDEVHMLTAPAFNALLKTLEEPPAHVKFIFATTEVQRIPVTILSRCQRFDFAGIGTPHIVARLREVVAGEQMRAEDEALELIARRAGGSMRDAQSLLDQLLAFGGHPQAAPLTVEQVHRLLGTAHADRVAALTAAVLEHDPPKALELLNQAADEGLNLGEVLDQLIAYWRDLMVVHCAGPQGRDLSVPSRHREALARQAAALPLDTILAGLDVLSTTKARLRGSSHGRVLAEMALVRLGRLEDLRSLTQLAQLLGNGEPAASRPGAAKNPASPPPARPRLSAAGTSAPAPRVAAPPEDEKKKCRALLTPRRPHRCLCPTNRCRPFGRMFWPRSARFWPVTWRKPASQQFPRQTLWSFAFRHSIICNVSSARSRHAWPGPRRCCGSSAGVPGTSGLSRQSVRRPYLRRRPPNRKTRTPVTDAYGPRRRKSLWSRRPLSCSGPRSSPWTTASALRPPSRWSGRSRTTPRRRDRV